MNKGYSCTLLKQDQEMFLDQKCAKYGIMHEFWVVGCDVLPPQNEFSFFPNRSEVKYKYYIFY